MVAQTQELVAAGSERSQPTRLKFHIKDIIFTSLTFYVAGMLAVNFFLLSLGTSDITIFETRFLIAGWTIYLLTLATVNFIKLANQAPMAFLREGEFRLGFGEDRDPVIVRNIQSCLKYFAFFATFSITWTVLSTQSLWRTAVIMLIPAFWGTVAIIGATRRHLRQAVIVAGSSRRGIMVFVLLSVGTALIVGALALPLTSQSYGGGRPKTVQVEISRSELSHWRGYSWNSNSPGLWFYAYAQQRWESDRFYIFEMESGDTIKLDKSEVRSVIPIEEAPGAP